MTERAPPTAFAIILRPLPAAWSTTQQMPWSIKVNTSFWILSTRMPAAAQPSSLEESAEMTIMPGSTDIFVLSLSLILFFFRMDCTKSSTRWLPQKPSAN